jgi:hypothetical protein
MSLMYIRDCLVLVRKTNAVINVSELNDSAFLGSLTAAHSLCAKERAVAIPAIENFAASPEKT